MSCEKFQCGDITTGRTELQSNADYQNLLSCFPIENIKHVKNSDFEDTIIKHVVSFILHKDHAVKTSWGEKTFYLGPDESITLPRLLRKLLPKELWENHVCSST